VRERECERERGGNGAYFQRSALRILGWLYLRKRGREGAREREGKRENKSERERVCVRKRERGG